MTAGLTSACTGRGPLGSHIPNALPFRVAGRAGEARIRWAAQAMKRAKVLTVTSGSQLEAALPGRFRELVTPEMCRAKGAVTVLVFGEKVARCRQVEEAWAQVPPDASTSVAFATDMTVEARTFLEERGAKVQSLRNFGWDEAAYRRIRS